jgi:hypothetical protein
VFSSRRPAGTHPDRRAALEWPSWVENGPSASPALDQLLAMGAALADGCSSTYANSVKWPRYHEEAMLLRKPRAFAF